MTGERIPFSAIFTSRFQFDTCSNENTHQNVRALHDHTLSKTAGPTNPKEDRADVFYVNDVIT
jgi:hypothetical protein